MYVSDMLPEYPTGARASCNSCHISGTSVQILNKCAHVQPLPVCECKIKLTWLLCPTSVADKKFEDTAVTHNYFCISEIFMQIFE